MLHSVLNRSARRLPTFGSWGQARTAAAIALASSASAALPRLAGAAWAAAPVPAPQTALGREIETLLLALRAALVLVPLGIVVAAVRGTRRERRAPAPRPAGGCDGCGVSGHAPDAAFCRHCGDRLVTVGGITP